MGYYLSDDDAKRIFAKTDTDKDGLITADDFYEVISKSRFH